MANYVKCPICDLNYIQAGESCCKTCDPKMRGKLLSDAEERHEEFRQQKWEEHKARKMSMEAFYAYRYNRKPNC